jgi:CRP-like cAMP-binding protein
VAVRQGERGDEFFIIERGAAEVLVREAGDDRMVAELRAGDFFGEAALLGTGIRQATVRAVTPLRLLVIGQRPFWSELAGAVGWQSKVRSALEERKRLEGLSLFEDASPRQLDLLAVKLQIRPTRAGDVIVRQGDPGDAFFIIREGRYEVEVETAGLRQRLNLLEQGDFFGEIALLRNVPRTATVRALVDGSLWRLERQDFRDLLGRYLQLEDQLAGIANSRVARGHSSGSAA